MSHESDEAVFPAAILFAIGVVLFLFIWANTSCSPLPVKPEQDAPVKVTGDCCAQAWPGTKQVGTHRTKLTGYYPDSSAMEGGFKTRYGDPLSTLQGFLSGKHKHVSVALDQDLGRVKRKMCSPELSKAYGKQLPLFVEDTGGAFRGKGYSRADICVANRAESFKAAVNSTVTLTECR
jgi:hypothetical protein